MFRQIISTLIRWMSNINEDSLFNTIVPGYNNPDSSMY